MLGGRQIINHEQAASLVQEVQENYGHDFTHYTKASLLRRLNQLCIIDNFASFAELRYRILNDSNYLQRFVEKITVNVTEMFRDPSFFRYLRDEVVPILRTYPFIRIWVAGCSTGEEAYSIAILLQEAKLLHKSLIYATDINPSVIEQASNGLFPMAVLKTYSENYKSSGGIHDFSDYYTANYNWVKWSSTLRERIIFANHNLVTDTSFNEFQLILCRNVLIYFDSHLQNQVFTLFDQSLETLGFLALGSKETLRFSPLAQTYNQIDGQKIWRKME